MKTHKTYEPTDRMISIIRDNYSVLQSLESFGIPLGFGDKTVEEICQSHYVDTFTFLAVVNFTTGGYFDAKSMASRLSVTTMLRYLRASHVYYLNHQLPYIRKSLKDSLREDDELGRLVMTLYDEYAMEIKKHMKYEERRLFPYVQDLLEGNPRRGYSIDTFSKHHEETGAKLKELKCILLKYLPQDKEHSHLLTMTLYGIYNNEEWLRLHAEVEDELFVPAIRALEQRLLESQVTQQITALMGKTESELTDNGLSEREKEIIVALVTGMSNKEIAEHLCISVNTVATHRRNITRKLQIHSTAGLTIFAIVNGLVDLSRLLNEE